MKEEAFGLPLMENRKEVLSRIANTRQKNAPTSAEIGVPLRNQIT